MRGQFNHSNRGKVGSVGPDGGGLVVRSPYFRFLHEERDSHLWKRPRGEGCLFDGDEREGNGLLLRRRREANTLG